MPERDLNQRIYDITKALDEKSIKANVQVKKRRGKGEYLSITVDDLDVALGKIATHTINEVLLNLIGYGTSTANFEDGTVKVEYVPLRKKEKFTERADNVLDSCFPAGGCLDNYVK